MRLAAGAADYIVKPFSPAPFRVGELALDRTKRRVTLAGRALRLPAAKRVSDGFPVRFRPLVSELFGEAAVWRSGSTTTVPSLNIKCIREFGEHL